MERREEESRGGLKYFYFLIIFQVAHLPYIFSLFETGHPGAQLIAYALTGDVWHVDCFTLQGEGKDPGEGEGERRAEEGGERREAEGGRKLKSGTWKSSYKVGGRERRE
jgi:hypothetical protein